MERLWSAYSQVVTETLHGVGSVTISPVGGGTLLSSTDTSDISLTFPSWDVS
jgi:hypothetical protein